MNKLAATESKITYDPGYKNILEKLVCNVQHLRRYSKNFVPVQKLWAQWYYNTNEYIHYIGDLGHKKNRRRTGSSAENQPGERVRSRSDTCIVVDRRDVRSVERDGVFIFGIRLLELKLKCDRNQITRVILDDSDTHTGGMGPFWKDDESSSFDADWTWDWRVGDIADNIDGPGSGR